MTAEQRQLHTPPDSAHEFVIIGSGASRGPLATNLVEAGFSVLLLEAGSDGTEGFATAGPADEGDNLDFWIHQQIKSE